MFYPDAELYGGDEGLDVMMLEKKARDQLDPEARWMRTLRRKRDSCSESRLPPPRMASAFEQTRN
eukprot:2659005-Alexandrium_andersonii.AAC.1